MEHEWEGRWPNMHGSARNFFRLMIYWKSLCLLDGKVRQGGFEVHPNLATTCLSENYEIPKFGWLRNLGISNFPTNPHLPASISGFLSFCSASICSVKLLVSGQRHPLLKGAFRQPCLPRSLWRLLWSNWRTLFTENMMWLFLIHLNSIESTCHNFWFHQFGYVLQSSHAQDFFNGIFEDNPDYRTTRLLAASVLHIGSCLCPCCCRFKEIGRLKGIPEDDIRKDLWRKKASMLRIGLLNS